jgi:hypothetical protein
LDQEAVALPTFLVCLLVGPVIGMPMGISILVSECTAPYRRSCGTFKYEHTRVHKRYNTVKVAHLCINARVYASDATL